MKMHKDHEGLYCFEFESTVGPQIRFSKEEYNELCNYFGCDGD